MMSPASSMKEKSGRSLPWTTVPSSGRSYWWHSPSFSGSSAMTSAALLRPALGADSARALAAAHAQPATVLPKSPRDPPLGRRPSPGRHQLGSRPTQVIVADERSLAAHGRDGAGSGGLPALDPRGLP